VIPTFSLIASCQSAKPIEITYTTLVLNEGSSISFSFKNVQETDHITCTSDYDSTPGHLGYFSISSYDKASNQITLTRNDVEIPSEVKCPVVF
jgi:hypothetical protein